MSSEPPRPPGPPPGPPADDEVERRLAAIKAGADPATVGAAAAPPGPPRPPGDAPSGAEPALVGEVVGPDGRTWEASRGGGAGSGEGAPGGPPGAGTRVVGWTFSQAQAGRLGLWIGVGLVAFGGYLVLAELVPGVAVFGSIALAVGGGVLVALHATRRAGWWAVNVGAVLAGFGVARLVAEVAGLPSAGWGTLGAGVGLLAVALVRAARSEGIHWQAWLGGALALWGGWGVLGATIPGFPTLGDLIVPLVLVLLGVAVLRRGFRPGP